VKCKGCGANYDPQSEYCPYCGRENDRLKKRREALERRQRSYEEKRRRVLEESADEIRLRKTNRLMWIMVGLAVLSFVLTIAFLVIIDISDKGGHAEKSVLEEYADKGRYTALFHYLSDTDMEDRAYPEYWQLEEFGWDVEDLRKYRDEYLHLDREKYREALFGGASMEDYDREYYADHFQFLIERILSDCCEILKKRGEYTGDSWRAEIYGPITPMAEKQLTEFEEEARATLWLLFGIGETELEELLEISYIDEEDAAPYVERQKEELQRG